MGKKRPPGKDFRSEAAESRRKERRAQVEAERRERTGRCDCPPWLPHSELCPLAHLHPPCDSIGAPTEGTSAASQVVAVNKLKPETVKLAPRKRKRREVPLPETAGLTPLPSLPETVKQDEKIRDSSKPETVSCETRLRKRA